MIDLGKPVGMRLLKHMVSIVKCKDRPLRFDDFAYPYFEMSFFMIDIAPPLYPPPNMAKWLRW